MSKFGFISYVGKVKDMPKYQTWCTYQGMHCNSQCNTCEYAVVKPINFIPPTNYFDGEFEIESNRL